MRTLLRSAILVAIATAASGCEIGDTYTPPDDAGGSGSGGGGLRIEWNSNPLAIPGDLSPDLTIQRAVFLQDALRLVGEAGEFALDRDKLEWSGGVVPAPLPVTGALPGLYSRLLFELDGDDEDNEYAYEIAGTVKINAEARPFTIRDTSDVAFMLNFSITLTAGETTTIPVRVEIDRSVNAVNFQSLNWDGMRYVIENGNLQIPAVRTAVGGAISISTSGPS